MSCRADVPDGVDSLHVKVMKVSRDSAARKAGVHCQMYLKTLCVSTRANGHIFPSPLVIGATLCRKDTTPRRLEDEIWHNNPIDDSNCVDINKLIHSVDIILSQAHRGKKNVSVELVEYIE